MCTSTKSSGAADYSTKSPDGAKSTTVKSSDAVEQYYNLPSLKRGMITVDVRRDKVPLPLTSIPAKAEVATVKTLVSCLADDPIPAGRQEAGSLSGSNIPGRSTIGWEAPSTWHSRQ